MAAPPRGCLYLVPVPLDFGCATQAPITAALPLETLQTAARLSHWICENAKTTRAFLNRVHAVAALQTPLQQQHVQELPRAVHKKGDHRPGDFDASPLLAPALQGHDMGLCSEAGMPAVADPGCSVVRAAHRLNVQVLPLPGSSALLLALAASGLGGQNFAFAGYLPQDGAQRASRIRELEALALRGGQTQIVIETPYRNAALLQALLHTLHPGTMLSVSHGLGLPQQHTRCAPVSAWRKTQQGAPDNDTPAVFIIGC